MEFGGIAEIFKIEIVGTSRWNFLGVILIQIKDLDLNCVMIDHNNNDHIIKNDTAIKCIDDNSNKLTAGLFKGTDPAVTF